MSYVGDNSSFFSGGGCDDHTDKIVFGAETKLSNNASSSLNVIPREDGLLMEVQDMQGSSVANGITH